MSYEPVHQGVMGYPYPGAGREYYALARPAFYDPPEAIGRGILLPQRRSPFIPADLQDDKVGTHYLVSPLSHNLKIQNLLTGIHTFSYSQRSKLRLFWSPWRVEKNNGD